MSQANSKKLTKKAQIQRKRRKIDFSNARKISNAPLQVIKLRELLKNLLSTE